MEKIHQNIKNVLSPQLPRGIKPGLLMLLLALGMCMAKGASEPVVYASPIYQATLVGPVTRVVDAVPVPAPSGGFPSFSNKAAWAGYYTCAVIPTVFGGSPYSTKEAVKDISSLTGAPSKPTEPVAKVASRLQKNWRYLSPAQKNELTQSGLFTKDGMISYELNRSLAPKRPSYAFEFVDRTISGEGIIGRCVYEKNSETTRAYLDKLSQMIANIESDWSFLRVEDQGKLVNQGYFDKNGRLDASKIEVLKQLARQKCDAWLEYKVNKEDLSWCATELLNALSDDHIEANCDKYFMNKENLGYGSYGYDHWFFGLLEDTIKNNWDKLDTNTRNSLTKAELFNEKGEANVTSFGRKRQELRKKIQDIQERAQEEAATKAIESNGV